MPRTGHWPSFGGIVGSLQQLGPLARRVDDLAILLPVIAGPDGEDPHTFPVALGDPRGVDPGGLRVAAFTDNGIRRPTADTTATVESAVAALATAGATIEWEVPPDLAEAWRAWEGFISADGYAWLRRLITAAGTPGLGSYDTRGWIDPRPPLAGDDLTALIERADDVRSRLLRWFSGFDLMVCPAMPQPAIRHGESNEPWFGDTYSDVHNLTGWPAVVVRGGTAPGGPTAPDGLPIGVQLIGRPWREDVAFVAARVVESASGGWQRPPI